MALSVKSRLAIVNYKKPPAGRRPPGDSSTTGTATDSGD